MKYLIIMDDSDKILYVGRKKPIERCIGKKIEEVEVIEIEKCNGCLTLHEEYYSRTQKGEFEWASRCTGVNLLLEKRVLNLLEKLLVS